MNIAEILKYCPKGIKLYSLVDGEVTLKRVTDIGACPILVEVKDGTHKYYTRYGLHFTSRSGGECVLFPSKDQRDWSKFRIPFKAGDIVMTEDEETPFIFKEYVDNIYAHCYCGVDICDTLKIEAPEDIYWTSKHIIPASEGAKKKLFDKIAEAGYKWNADTLELEKIKPKFNEGDVLINKNTNALFLFTGIIINNSMQVYSLYSDGTFIACNISPFSVKLASMTDRSKLASAMVKGGYRYDRQYHILVDMKQNLKPFEKVLVRDEPNEEWSINIFSYYDKKDEEYPYRCLSGCYSDCIPYEGNEYLLGTTTNPPFNNYIE